MLVDRDYSVRQAGGFIIQLMPAATEDTISRLEKNLSGITSVTSLLDSGKTPEDILAMITDGMDFEITDHIEPSYYCNCSKERVQKALVSLGKEELTSMIEEGKTIEVHCDFCNRYYYFTVEELGTLMEEADC